MSTSIDPLRYDAAARELGAITTSVYNDPSRVVASKKAVNDSVFLADQLLNIAFFISSNSCS